MISLIIVKHLISSLNNILRCFVFKNSYNSVNLHSITVPDQKFHFNSLAITISEVHEVRRVYWDEGHGTSERNLSCLKSIVSCALLYILFSLSIEHGPS